MIHEYEDALKELLRKKEHGEKIEAPRPRESGNVINLMDALRRSARGEKPGEKTKARSTARRRTHHRKATRKTHAPARHRKAG